jgi:hypothetical protein
MKKYLLIFIWITCFSCFTQAQTEEVDSLTVPMEVDTSHSPKVATIMSAILPSSGHFYNQFHKIEGQKNNLWWKLPIIYGGLGAMTYLTISNHQEYRMFKDERLARLDANYVSDELAFLNDSQLKVYQDQYERWRNLSIIGGLLVYTLQLIDVNVEAHLMHFDTSDNLSFNWQPSINLRGNSATYGMTIRISFK